MSAEQERTVHGGSGDRNVTMNPRPISFAIQGMVGAKCAASVERALAGLDGIASAHVNYASERAMVMYDSARVSIAAMVRAVRGEGFDVPLERATFCADDLLYASSARAIERALECEGGVVQASANLAARQIVLDIIPDATTHENLLHALARWRFRAVESPSGDAWIEFAARGLVIGIWGIVLVWGAVNHGGIFAPPSELPSPILLGALTALVLFGAGLPFFRRAFAAGGRGELDASVFVAFITLVVFLCGAGWSVAANARPERIWTAWSGYVAATLLTMVWFVARGFTAFVLPRFAARRSALPTPRNS